MSNGPLMFDLQGTSLSSEEKELLRHPAVGGIILFSRNYESPEQLASLVKEIHQVRTPALLVAVDQEGGRVQRFRKGFTELPSASSIGNLYKHNREKGRNAAREIGWLMAAELRVAGIDFSFAPVLDLDTGASQVIGDRAFADSVEAIGELAFSWAAGAREAGMASVGKHFPGHGCVEADSHHELPRDGRPLEDILRQDLVPFHHLIENGLEGIMPAHVVYSRCDQQPAGYSRFWIQEILRNRLGFSGVVFSDDLTMEGASIAGTYEDRANRALEAGCDMILVCNNQSGAVEVMELLKDYRNPASQARLVRMHGHGQLTSSQLKEMPRWHHALQLVTKLEDHSSLSLDL